MAMVKDKLIEVVEHLDEFDAAQVLEFAVSLRSWEEWDRQIETDSKAGKLGKFEAMAAEALREHAEGKTTPL